MDIYLVGTNKKPYFADECGVFFLTRGTLLESRAWTHKNLEEDAQDPDTDGVIKVPLTGAQLGEALKETYNESKET